MDPWTPSIAFLYAAPLVLRYRSSDGGPDKVVHIDLLNIDGELDGVKEGLQSVRKNVKLRVDCAKYETLRDQLHSPTTNIIHYSGHGMDNGALCFESGDGFAELFEPRDLELMCNAQGNEQAKERLVFVSACHSESVARAFLKAGIKHVIAVKLEYKVPDECARYFASQFCEFFWGGSR